jgi:hypothetical protein
MKIAMMHLQQIEKSIVRDRDIQEEKVLVPGRDYNEPILGKSSQRAPSFEFQNK